MTKTIWVDTTGASTTYVPREKPIQESVAPFSGTISGAAPATTNLGTNSGQRILAADGTWIPQPAFTSGGADQLETLRPSVISTSYSANPPTVTDSAKAYDSDTNHATTFGQWYAAQEARINNRVDIFSLTTWASKTQTWTAATINVSRSYAILQDGESASVDGLSSKTSSVKYEFSTNNGSSWTTLGTDTQSSIPTAPQTLSMALGSLTPTMGNILVKVTITRGGGGTIYEDGVSLPGLTGEVDLKLFDVWIDGTYAGGAGNITCNNLTVTGDATFQNKIYDSTASAGTTGQVLKVAANGKVTWATDSAGTGTVTSITTTGANGVTISGGSTQTITTSGTFALALGNITPTSISTGTGSFSGDVEFAASIKSPNGSNSPIVISPDGTGDLHVNADSLRLGDNNADATIATNGTGDLILTTHEGSVTQGIIRLYDGANGNITLTPNGTGQVQVGSDQVVTLIASQTLTNKTLSTSSTWNGNTIGVAYGGTGSTTLTSGSYVVGNGTSAVTLKTPTQVTADLDTFTYQIGGTAGKKGLVPAAPAIGASVVYLDQTGSWTTPSGSGTTTNALTISSPLTGTSFNGSTAVTIALGSGYGDTQNPYASKTANYVLAAPSGSAGVPTFRAIVAADIPTLNQNTTGSAGSVPASGITGSTLASGVTASSLTSVGTLTGLTVSGTTSLATSSGFSQIGTASNYTSSKLQVYGNIDLVNTSTSQFIRFYDGTTFKGGLGTDDWVGGSSANLTLVSNGDSVFRTTGSATERMRIVGSSGNVGIGTASPSAKLQVVGTTKIGEGVASNSSKLMVNTVSGVAAGIQLFQDAVESWIIQNPASITALTFSNSGTERMRIDGSSGNVGIGTTSPVSRLHISDANKAFDNYGNINVFTSDAAAVDKGGAIAFGGANTTGGTSPYVFAKIQGIKEGAANTWSGALLFGTTASNSAITERMRIDSSGNVGIGTSSPSAKLDINGDTVIRSSNKLYFGVTTTLGSWTTRTYASGSTQYYNGQVWIWNNEGYGSTEYMRLDSGGNLGIGTTSPSAKLSVNSGANRQIYIGQNTSNTNYNAISLNGSLSDSGLMGLAGGGTGDETLYVMSQGNMVFRTVGTNERMRIDSSGNVGIGTSSPASKLNVSGGNVTVSAGYGIAWSGDQNRIMTPEDNVSGALIRYGSGGICRFLNGSTEHFRVDASGNVKALGVLLGNNGTKGYGAITTTTSTSTPTGGSSGDHYYIY